ncbi:hypothetical protein DPMN_179999 [Dreissena polymorpha]|uniref:Helitron helicase-like domain-containing protein n=1 Tax=Dreissena polymorpha TaxID=45954 RepID=A0A9D4IMQ5_DREPO|nr:hypothetical protein DPMN_179999 [Dreissena polymorpha]
MKTAFKIDTFWYRYEFAKSRGMIHFHGLCWRSDREPHNLLHEALKNGLDEDVCASKLSEWAQQNFAMTAMHPAGSDASGNPNKDLWPPPEGNAPAPPESKNPLFKLFMDISQSENSILEDHLLLTNKINLHRCSSYCLVSKKGMKHKVCGMKHKVCRMEFGSENMQGKAIRDSPAIVKDKNGSLRLEMKRDHPFLVQHSQYHTQAWRANGDISLILSKSSPDNPSISDIIATEKYVSGYACKGNQPTGEVVDLFNAMVNATDETSSTDGKSLCTKLLMNTIKRDISSMEAAYELTGLPLFHSSHQFQSVSMSGSRVLEKNWQHLHKKYTSG